MSAKKIKLRHDIEFGELDNYATIPKGTEFKVEYWQGINGQLCPIVRGSPFVKDIIYFTDGEYIPLEK